MSAVAGAVATLAFVALIGPAHAGAWVYWTSYDGSAIGRADNGGGSRQERFIPRVSATGIAVTDRHILWLDVDRESIGRARIDGTHVKRSFIPGVGFGDDLAVGDDYLYWTHPSTLDQEATIARSRLDGSDVDVGFLPLDPRFGPSGIDAHGGWIYWTNTYPAHTIGRARTDGSDADPRFIPGRRSSSPDIVAAASHLFFPTRKTKSIARSDLDGEALELEFVPGIGTPSSIASDRRHLYWTGGLAPVVRSRIDGSRVRPLLRRIRADYVAVDGRGPG